MASKKKESLSTILCVDFTRKDRENAVQERIETDSKGRISKKDAALIKEVVEEITDITYSEVS